MSGINKKIGKNHGLADFFKQFVFLTQTHLILIFFFPHLHVWEAGTSKENALLLSEGLKQVMFKIFRLFFSVFVTDILAADTIIL